MSDDNLNDEIEEEYEVILSHINDVSFHIFQFPMTSTNNSMEKVWQSAFIRTDGGSFQLSYYSNEASEGNPPTASNDEMTDHSIPRQGSNEKPESTNKSHLYTINSKSCLSSANCVVAGYFDHANKKLYITPISSIQQFRPNFSLIDQKRLNSMNVGMVERQSDSADKDERDQSLDDLVLNHGNNTVDNDTNNSSNNNPLYFGSFPMDSGKFYTTGTENWIKIPCIYPFNSYESIEMIKALMNVRFDDFISWNDLNPLISDENCMVNQLLSIKHSRNKVHHFDGDIIKYFKMISGIASDGESEFNLPFGGDGQVLPTLRTSGLPKIYTAYQYPPSCPSSSLGGSMCYNFGGNGDSSLTFLTRNSSNKYGEFLPFHGISGKLLIYDDWLYYGPLSVQELYRMKLSDQIQRITLVYQVIPFHGIKNILKRIYDVDQEDHADSELSLDFVKVQDGVLEQANSRNNQPEEFPSDQKLIKILRKFCVLVSGNWVYKSELMYNEYESCCRDLILVLLQRDENAGLNREPIRVATDLPQIKVTNILQEVAVYRSTAWYPKFSFDKKFIEENIEEATFWKSYWAEREKYVVQYIRDNRDTSICTSTYLNNLSAVSTSVSNSQLQLLLIFILKIYGATNISELLNLCSYHLTLMYVGNASIATLPSMAGGNSSLHNSSSKPSDSSSQSLESSAISSGKTGPSSKFSHRGSNISGSMLSGPSLNQNFIAPTYSPFCSNNPRHNMKQIPFINVNPNVSPSIKINKEDINKSLEMIATKIFDDLWVLRSTGDPRMDAIRKIVIGYFSHGDREDIFTITSFIDNIKHCIVNNCAALSQKNKIWHKFDSDEDLNQVNDETSNSVNASMNSSQLLHILNNVPEFIWRKIIHEFAFPINETATVWKLKGK